MCGRYTQHHTTEALVDRFAVQTVREPVTERYNVAPTQPTPVITFEGARCLDAFRWGLIPSWAKEPGSGIINARAETLAEKPSFKAALARRRCLLPADGFFEWKKEENGRQPIHIRLKGGDLFAFAGLWEVWDSPEGAPLHTCAIVTVAPNDVLAPIHNRMPAILRPEDEAAWLDPAVKGADALQLLRSYPAARMEAYAVSRRVNTPFFDDPVCILPQ
ncbi:MAG TPA: SOS response-associated peptidase [Chthonomonadaceae bacterium]|nr:SOS response-associated peptidase [Chthonomonadaceae bacterium]